MGYYWRVPFKNREARMRAYVAISLAMESFAVNVWSYARRIVPVDTGSLRNSIRIVKSEGREYEWVRYSILAGSGDIETSGLRTIGRGGGGVGTGIMRAWTKGKQWRDPYYALYVELGTVRMKAKPFMRPAFNKYKYKLRAAVRKTIRTYF